MSPRVLLAVLAAISGLLVAAAVAWACAPQSQVETDKPSYEPGEQMTISGRYFPPDAAITITTDPPGPSATTTSTSARTFQTQLEAPSQPGVYVLLVTSSEWTARRTFEVVDAQAEPPPPDPAEPPPPAPGRCANERLGTGGPDNLPGTNAGDRILAFAGDDVVNALAADDCLNGGSGADRLYGGLGHDTVVAQTGNDQASGADGNDRLSGGDGDDRLSAGTGRDFLAGGRGADVLGDHLGDGQLYGESGADRIYAGRGRFRIDAGYENDYVSARNGLVDAINCGPGSDTARVDRVDRVAGCERVIRG